MSKADKRVIEVSLELEPISKELDEDVRSTVCFTGRVQKEEGLLGINYDLSFDSLHTSLSHYLCKDSFDRITLIHRVGFVPVGQVTSIISVFTKSNHSQALDLLKKIIDHIKLKAVHKKYISV